MYFAITDRKQRFRKKPLLLFTVARFFELRNCLDVVLALQTPASVEDPVFVLLHLVPEPTVREGGGKPEKVPQMLLL